MPAVGRSISAVVNIPAGEAVENIIANLPGQVLQQDGAVEVYLTRSAVGLLFTVTIGGTNVYPAAPANINATLGTLPSTQDDNVISVLADAADPIIIQVANSTAGDLEARALVKYMPVGGLQLKGGRSK